MVVTLSRDMGKFTALRGQFDELWTILSTNVLTSLTEGAVSTLRRLSAKRKAGSVGKLMAGVLVLFIHI